MSSHDRFQSLIADLLESRDDTLSSQRIDAIRTYFNAFDASSDRTDIQICLATLIDGEGVKEPLPSFLRQIIMRELQPDTRLALMDMFVQLTAHREVTSEISAHQANALLTTAFYTIRAEKSAKVKSRAFELINQSLKFVADSPHTDQTANQPQLSFQPQQMVTELFTELGRNKTSISTTTRGHSLTTLGRIAQYFPDSIRPQATKLADYFMRALKNEVESSSTVDSKGTEGLLNGLRSFCIHFSSTLTREQLALLLNTLRRCFKMDQGTRFDLVKAALSFFKTHASLFVKDLASKELVEELLVDLFRMSKHRNRLVMLAAMGALDAFLRATMDAVMIGDDTNLMERRKSFLLLLNFFNKKLIERHSLSEVSSAISAFGILSKGVRVFMNQTELGKYFDQLLQSSSHVFQVKTSDEQNEAIDHLPAFIGAFAFILNELVSFDSNGRGQILALVMKLIHLYPTLTSSQRMANVQAMTRLFVVLNEKHSNHFSFIVDDITHAGLILTISKLPNANATFTSTDAESPVVDLESYVEYSQFWLTLFGVWIPTDARGRYVELNQYAWNSGLNFDAGAVNRMRKIVFNSLIQHSSSIVQRLDLSLQPNSDDDVIQIPPVSPVAGSSSVAGRAAVVAATTRANDVSSVLTPVRSKDFALYLKLIQFLQRLFMPPLDPESATSNQADNMSSSYTHYVESIPSTLPAWNRRCLLQLSRWLLTWLLPFGSVVIEQSTSHPLISGYYKLAGILISVADFYKFFNRTCSAAESRISVKNEPSDEKMSDETLSQNSLRVDQDDDVFISDALALSSQQQRAHVSDMFNRFLHDVITRMAAFAQLDLLFAAMKLVLSAPAAFCDISSLLPVLSRALGLGITFPPAAVLAIDTLDSWNSNSSTRKELVDGLRVVMPHFNDYLRPLKPDASAMEKQVVYRMLEFIGTVGNSSQLLMADIVSAPDRWLSWSEKEHIRYALPFSRMLDVHLDSLLPRLCYLAASSSDRETKVHAGEALHSIMILIVAIASRDPNRQDGVLPSSFEPLFKKLFPTILHLSCDIEPVIVQLFHPLLTQLIHWFTNRLHVYDREMRTLLDAILDGLIDPVNSDLRQVSADAVFEFFKWSTKNAGTDDKLVNASLLFRRLLGFARHTSHAQRLGAAMAFTRMYKLYREHDELVSTYILDIVNALLQSLQLSARDDESNASKEETCIALDHYINIIAEPSQQKYAKLKAGKNRSGTEECQNLGTFVSWLWSNISTPEDDFRRYCQSTFVLFAPLISPTIKTEQAWLAKWREQHSDAELVELIELNQDNAQSIVEPGWLRDQDVDSSNESQMKNWLQSLAACFDCYTWIIHSKICDVDFVDALLDNPHSSIMSSINFFCHQAVIPLESILVRTSHANLADIRQKQSTALIRLFRLSHVMLSLRCRAWLDVSWCKLLWQSLLQPESIGLIVTSAESLSALHATIGALVSALHGVDSKQRTMLLTELKSRLHDPALSPMDYIESPGLFLDPLSASIRLSAYRQLVLSKWLEPAIGKSSCSKLARSLLTLAYHLPEHEAKLSVAKKEEQDATCTKVRAIHEMSPVMARLGHQLLELALLMDLQPHSLLVCLTGHSDADLEMVDEGVSERKPSLEASIVFYRAFRSLIDSYLLSHWSRFASPLLSASCNNADLFSLVVNVGEFALQRRTRKERGAVSSQNVTLFNRDVATPESSSAESASQQANQFVDDCLSKFPAAFANHGSLSFPADSTLALLILRLIALLNDLDRTRTFSVNPSLKLFGEIVLACMAESAPFQTKLAAIRILPLFLDDEFRPTIEVVSGELRDFRAAAFERLRGLVSEPPFPTVSTDLAQGSTMWKDYTAMLDVLLAALRDTRSFKLLYVLLPKIRERDHGYKATITHQMHAFVSSVNEAGKPEQSSKLIENAFEVFMDMQLDLHPVNNARAFLVRQVILPLLRICPLSVVNSFFAQHLTVLWNRCTTFEKAVLPMYGGDDLLVHYLDLELIYDMFTVMFKRLSVPDIHAKKKDFHKEMMREANKLVKKIQFPSNGFPVLRVRIAAWHTLTATLCRTQVKVKFFDEVGFGEDAKRGDTLWAHLLDTQSNWTFGIDTNFQVITPGLEEFMSDRSPQSPTASRSFARVGRWFDSSMSQASQDALGMSRYLTSQYLGDSSLSQDASGFFGSDESQQPQSQSSDEMDTSTDASNPASLTGATKPGAAFEADVIMAQDAMPVALEFVDYIINAFGPEYMQKPSDLPPWIETITTKLQSSDANDVHPNIKWSFIKLIQLRHMFFENWKTLLWPLIARFVILPPDSNGGVGFHYMLRDTCVLFLRWNVMPRRDHNEEMSAASSFLSHLMRVASDHGPSTTNKGSKLRSNTIIIRQFVERWNKLVSIPKSVILGYLKHDFGSGAKLAQAKTARIIGCQLLGMCLEQNMPVYEPGRDHDIREEEIASALLGSVQSDYVKVSRPAAEVYGLVLKNLTALGAPSARKSLWFKPLQDFIKSEFGKSKHANLVDVLYNIALHAHHTEFMSAELVRRLFTLPFLHDEKLVQQLMMLLMWVPARVELFDSLYASGWIERVLEGNDSVCHQRLLFIMCQRLSEVSLERLRSLMPRFQKAYDNHPLENIRAAWVRLCIAIQVDHEAVKKLKDDDRSDPFLVQMQLILAHGLQDPSAMIRESITNFLNSAAQLAESPLERFLQIMELLCNNSVASSWLPSVVSLLLRPIQNSSEWDRPISDVPIDEARAQFSAYPIDSGAYTRNATFTPLFDPSSQQQMEDDDEDAVPMDDDSDEQSTGLPAFNPGIKSNRSAPSRRMMINATQTPLFPSTQSILSLDANQLVELDMSQNPENVHLFYRQARNDDRVVLGSQADAFVTPQERIAARKLKQKVERGSVKQKRTIMSRVELGKDKLQTRFMSQPGGSSFAASQQSGRHFAKVADMTNRIASSARRRQRETIQQRVQLLRSYRQGELPDIQIKHSELLRPILSLHVDPQIAHSLFNLVVPMLFEQAKTWLNSRGGAAQVKEFHEKASTLMCNTLLSMSKLPSAQAEMAAPAINAIQCTLVKVALPPVEHECLAFMSAEQIESISDLAIKSNNVHSGIRLLEVALDSAQKAATQVSRSKSTGRGRSKQSVAPSVLITDNGDGVSASLLPHETLSFELAKLYAYLGEDDVALHLYTLSTHHPITRQALRASLKGDPFQAEQHYKEIIDVLDRVSELKGEGASVDELTACWEEAASNYVQPVILSRTASQQQTISVVPSTAETKLWYAERLETARALAQWEDLTDTVRVDIDDDLSKLFLPENRDPDYLDHFLVSSLKHAELMAIAPPKSDNRPISDIRNELDRFAEQYTTSPASADLLKTTYPHHMLRIYCLNGSPAMIQYRQLSYDAFLRSWDRMPVLAHRSRAKALNILHQVTDLAEFIRCQPQSRIKAISESRRAARLDAHEYFVQQVDTIHQQFKRWGEPPSAIDSLESWDDFVTHRPAFMMFLHKKLKDQLTLMQSQPHHAERVALVEGIQTDMTLLVVGSLNKASLAVGASANFKVGLEYCRRSREFHLKHRIPQSNKLLTERLLDVARYHSRVKFDVMEAKYCRDEVANDPTTIASHVEILTKRLAQLEQNETGMFSEVASSPHVHYRFLRLRASICEELALLYQVQSKDRASEDNYAAAEASYSQLSNFFVKQQIRSVSEDSTRHKISSVSMLMSLKSEDHILNSRVLINKAAKSFALAAQFAEDRISASEEITSIFNHGPSRSKSTLDTSTEQHLIDLLVRNVMHGMCLNDVNARALFPRALELLPRLPSDSDCRHLFQVMTSGYCDRRGASNQLSECQCHSDESVNRIPLWMFLQWLPQMMGYMGTKDYRLVAPIIEQLASKYQQAVYFPFQLSSSGLQDRRDNLDSANKQLLLASEKRIKQALSSRLLPRLVDAFDQLTFPEHKAKDMWTEVKSYLAHRQFKEAVETWHKFRDTTLAPVTSSRSDIRGPVGKKFATTFRKRYEEALGDALRDERKASQANVQAMHKSFVAVNSQVENDPSCGSVAFRGHQQIAQFSPWLANYHSYATQARESIEIPGQYNGQSEPKPETHVMIDSFDAKTLVLSSLRKPKRVTIIGSNEKPMSLLVKAGEDMRLDQRIEQIFDSFNHVLSKDRQTAQKAFKLRTYAVMPFTARLGCVEWMANTTTLKSIITEVVGESEFRNASSAFPEMLVKLSPDKNLGGPALTLAVLEHANYTKVVNEYDALVMKWNPVNYLQRRLVLMASSTESFITIRARFAHSYAAVTAAGYVLGIGDRHMDNFLLDERTGDVAVIDFGAAFGQGVLLTVPELMTARFTPQLASILSPLPTLDLLATDLIACLTAFHRQRELLMTVMSVFVNEPNMEWTEQAKSKNKTRNKGNRSAAMSIDDATATNEAVTWYPRRKLAISRAKLSMVNPARIMIEELNDNSSLAPKANLRNVVNSVVLGNDRGSKRSQVGQYCTSIEQQVQLIIEQATDSNILGRTWQGWMPHM